MLVASMHLTLRLHASGSLKEKRFVVSSVKQRLRNRFNVAVAETGGHESWREAELGVVTVGGVRAVVDRELTAVTRFLDNDGRFEVVDRLVEYF
jgi:uncharacterized protein YlxP (DUF503 family)